jgi:RNA polymerase sigma-70 factor, ECF subfamily
VSRVSSNGFDTDVLVLRACQDDPDALGRLFVRYTERLHAMLDLRLDRRLQGRVDVSDILQETFLDASRSFHRYRTEAPGSFYLWLRCIAERQLIDIHRRHLGVQARDPRREIPLDRVAVPEASSAVLAVKLLGNEPSPSEVFAKAEVAARVEAALETMDPADREVPALRHFERLSNGEAAQVLGIGESAASKRHLRALIRLKEILKTP